MTSFNTKGYNQGALKGRRIVCATSGKVHIEWPETRLVAVADASWLCNTDCGERHCSQCWYDTDGGTITVTACGRFPECECIKERCSLREGHPGDHHYG